MAIAAWSLSPAPKRGWKFVDRGFRVTYRSCRINYPHGRFKAAKQNLKVGRMKREYEKPEFKKAVMTLQAVTAIANTTGSRLKKGDF